MPIINAGKGKRSATKRKQASKKKKKSKVQDIVMHTDLFETYPEKIWKTIRATHINHEGLRHQIVAESERYLFCRVKLPSAEMDEIGCTGCSGPHNKRNKRCNAVSEGPIVLPPMGALMDMSTRGITSYRLAAEPVVWNKGCQKAGRVLYHKIAMK